MKTNAFLRAIMSKPRKTRIIILLLILIIIAGLVLFFYLKRTKTQIPPLPTVGVETVDTSKVNLYGEYVGRIRAQQSVEVHARVEGYLEKMCFKEGTYITKGQPLFIIDPRIYQANVNKARALLNKAEAQERKAKHDLDRITPLYAQNAASQLDLDNAQAAYETARAEVEVSRADLTQAELTLGYTVVPAPISGYISEGVTDIGTLVGPGAKSHLATIVKSDTVRVDFSMTSLDYLRSRDSNVKFGDADSTGKRNSYVTVTLADGTKYPHKGRVDFSEPQVDPKTGTFSVRAEMPNPEHTLLPGEFTKVRVLLDVRENAIDVPTKSLIIEKNGVYIYVMRPDSTVEKRFVQVGPETGNNTIIERGLSQGERIVVEGFHKLNHGMKVAPSDSVATPASAEQTIVKEV